MSILIKIICPQGIVTASDTREMKFLPFLSKKKIPMGVNDKVQKTYTKEGFVISVVGNKKLNGQSIYQVLPNVLENIDREVTFKALNRQLATLYAAEKNPLNAAFIISFYDNINQMSVHSHTYVHEPIVQKLDIANKTVSRINSDVDGFTYGIHWEGDDKKMIAMIRRNHMNLDSNQLTIDMAKAHIVRMIGEINEYYQKTQEKPSIGGWLDFAIQTPEETIFHKNHIKVSDCR